MDNGHYHPTEMVSDKSSSQLLFHPKLALHISRPVRWDSDHVVRYDDELREIAKEVVASGRLNDVVLALDYFDASINRIAAWVIGTRSLQKGLLEALLTPYSYFADLQAKSGMNLFHSPVNTPPQFVQNISIFTDVRTFMDMERIRGMREFKGFGVYGAIAIGRAAVLREEREEQDTGTSGIPDPTGEEIRLNRALELAGNQLDGLYEQTLSRVGEEEAEIFAIHRMMLEDPDFVEGVRKKIKDGATAESAVRGTARELSDLLIATGDDYLRERSTDIRDASETLVAALMGKQRSIGLLPKGIPDPILCADDLTPSQTAGLDKDKIRAFVTAGGSSNSHTAILARSRGIPAVVALGKDFLEGLEQGQVIAVNGYTGQVFLDPDPSVLEELTRKMEQDQKRKEELRSLVGKESRTQSGKKVDLYANIGGVDDLTAALDSSAEGIGLMRSEFLYLGRRDYPSEEVQFAAYKLVLERMARRRVVIRTLDIGADKQADYFGIPREENPALGYRAIRICLDRVDLFKTQLRALYRASLYGKLAILFPMIASVWEVESIRRLCRQVQSELEAEGIGYCPSVELGIMIETPASAILSDKLAGYVDFFSIGTNDLTQYTLACDRQNSRLARYCDPHHEAIFRLIETVSQNAHRQGKWVGICGELAADTRITGRLIGMGIDELSVSPAAVLDVRKAILECQ